MASYNTGLAAEYHVLSALTRLGLDACLTMGNRKAVDIFLFRDGRPALRLDVKGVAGPHDWTVQPQHFEEGGPDFLVLVSYEGRIGDPTQAPRCWVMSTEDAAEFRKVYPTRTILSRSRILREGERFLEAWGVLSA